MFNSYEELLEAAEQRRSGDLVIEVDVGSEYSPEYEKAKEELGQAQTLAKMTGGGFLADNQEELQERVDRLRPEPQLVWVKFRKLSTKDWSLLNKKMKVSPIDQYEEVLASTFVGLYGTPDTDGDPLTTDPNSVSTKNGNGVFDGGTLNQVIQAFMTWQNSSGEINISPTKSGQD